MTKDAAQGNRESAKGTDTNPDKTPNTQNAEKTGKGPIHPLAAGAAKANKKPTQGNKKGVSDPVKAEQADPMAGTGPSATGVVPDGVERREYLSRVFSDIDAALARVQSVLAPHFDVSGLLTHLYAARDWVANELGMEKGPDGGYMTHAGYGVNPSAMGQTTGQVKAADEKAKAKTSQLKSGYDDKDPKKTSHPVSTGANQESTSDAAKAKKDGNKPSA